MQKTLIGLGCILIIIGLAWPVLSYVKIGQLPGDIIIKRNNFAFYFPSTTCLLLSLIGMFITWLFRVSQ